VTVAGGTLPSPVTSAAMPEQIVVGIRPERLSLAESSDTIALDGAVAMREVLGAEIVLHVESPAGSLTVRTDAGAPARVGDNVRVWLDPRAVHLFDGATEVRL
jgi:ABC-type sugar transport system ATPase subunit